MCLPTFPWLFWTFPSCQIARYGCMIWSHGYPYASCPWCSKVIPQFPSLSLARRITISGPRVRFTLGNVGDFILSSELCIPLYHFSSQTLIAHFCTITSPFPYTSQLLDILYYKWHWGFYSAGSCFHILWIPTGGEAILLCQCSA